MHKSAMDSPSGRLFHGGGHLQAMNEESEYRPGRRSLPGHGSLRSRPETPAGKENTGQDVSAAP